MCPGAHRTGRPREEFRRASLSQPGATIGMPFSTRPEIQALASLQHALTPLGYSISQKVRVLDVMRAADEIRDATTPVGPSLADMLFPLLRARAGSLRPEHPWLRPGDRDYAFQVAFRLRGPRASRRPARNPSALSCRVRRPESHRPGRTRARLRQESPLGGIGAASGPD